MVALSRRVRAAVKRRWGPGSISATPLRAKRLGRRSGLAASAHSLLASHSTPPAPAPTATACTPAPLTPVIPLLLSCRRQTSAAKHAPQHPSPPGTSTVAGSCPLRRSSPGCACQLVFHLPPVLPSLSARIPPLLLSSPSTILHRDNHTPPSPCLSAPPAAARGGRWAWPTRACTRPSARNSVESAAAPIAPSPSSRRRCGVAACLASSSMALTTLVRVPLAAALPAAPARPFFLLT